MTIVGTRQAFIGCASLPPIKRMENIDIEGYETIVKVFEEALMLKQCFYYRDDYFKKQKIYKGYIDTERAMYKDCLQQTITFLKHIHALRQAKPIKKIMLWKDCVKMSPFYEGVTVQLKTMLIAHHCPSMAAAMDKGATYAHQTLTNIGEAVLYLMEYFQKEGLFEDVDEVRKTNEIREWVEEHRKWLNEHKEEVEQKNKEREEYRKKEMEELNKKMLELDQGDNRKMLSGVINTLLVNDVSQSMTRLEDTYSRDISKLKQTMPKPPKQIVKQASYKQPIQKKGRRY